MPAFRRTVGSQNIALIPTSHTLQARAESSSEAAALHGQKALTPIIAGTISGTCVGVAWLVALIVILLKRYRQRKRYKKVGHAERRSSQRRAGEFIVPPDPAVLEGSYQPGERIVLEEKRRWWRKGSHRANSKSQGRTKGKEKAMALGRLGPAPGPRPEPRSQRLDGQISFRSSDEADITEEEIQHTPYPPFHRLSTIMSIADPQRSLDRISIPPEPPSKDVPEHSDVRNIDFAASDDYPRMPVPADRASARAHRYPPRSSHGW